LSIKFWQKQPRLIYLKIKLEENTLTNKIMNPNAKEFVFNPSATSWAPTFSNPPEVSNSNNYPPQPPVSQGMFVY
jgi:hypothetical protein